MNRKILCVDDEEAILSALQLHVRKVFEMHTANNAAQGLEVFEKDGPFAVVTADMRMPGGDGATMLAKIKEIDPNVATILLTGHADFEFGGADALQSGKIFKILTKPCPPDRFKHVVEEGIQLYNAKVEYDQ
ncbi:MAG: response regulator [Opitutales bacterium]|jgi:DNA-binding NtrC family response regulator